jgi:hypothetical protein
MNYLRQNHLSVELIDKLLLTLLERQQTINRQLEENEKKYNLRVEESNRLFNESEKKIFRRMEEKKQHLIDYAIKAENEEEDAFKKTEQGSKKGKVIQSARLHVSGELNEHLVCPEIIKRFNELGYYFDDITSGGRRILDNSGGAKAEFNIILENLQFLIAVQIIANPKKKDIEHHLGSLKILREHRDKYKDKRKIYGAITGNQFGSEEKQAILENGIYLFEQSGKTIKLYMPDNFFPLEL